MVITGGRSEGLAKDGGLRPEAKKTRQSLRLLASPRFSSFSLLDPLYLKEVAKREPRKFMVIDISLMNRPVCVPRTGRQVGSSERSEAMNTLNNLFFFKPGGLGGWAVEAPQVYSVRSSYGGF